MTMQFREVKSFLGDLSEADATRDISRRRVETWVAGTGLGFRAGPGPKKLFLKYEDQM